MSNAVLKGNASGTGTVTLETPNTNSDLTISMPAAAGTMMVSGNMPAFRVYNNTIQTIAGNGTNTKVDLNTEVFDTNNNFASSRFTPTVAGYYQFTATIRDNTGPASGQLVTYIYKNSAIQNFQVASFAGSVGVSCTCNALIYCNGTTDYIEMFVSQNSGSNIGISQSQSSTYFMGSMVRAA